MEFKPRSLSSFCFCGFIVCCLLLTRDSSAQWSKNSAVNDTIVVAGGNQSVPVIAPDGSGGAIVVWQDERNGRPDIYANRIKASGRLAWMLDGVPIANLPESDQKSPAVVGNGQGAVFVAWQDDRNNSALSIFDIYAQKIDVLFGNSQWTPQGVLVQTGNNYVFPNIIRDSIFGAIVASYTFFNNNYFIFLQKLGDDTGDMQWDPQTVPSSQLESPQPLCPPAIISDDNRGAIIVWPDQRELPNGKLKVFAAQLKLDGTPGWPQKEVPLSLPLRESTEPAIIPDGSGGVIVAWITPQADGSSNDQISVQRLSAQGLSQWSRVVSTSPGSKGNVRIVRVNQDTSLVLWEDLGSGQDKDLRVHRINSLGEEIEAEFDIVSELGAQINPAVIANKRNGVIVAWEDNRSLQTDIYAQLIDANASLPWGPNGIAVSTAPDVQKHPVLVDDGLGGAIIVWEDKRNGVNRDIYAQKVSVQGVLGEFRMIDVLAPNAAGVNWEIGSSQEIRWNFQGEIDSVSIELSRDGGQTFPEVIFSATENVNSAIWQRVTGPASDQCKIRINAANANFILDESDTLFTISNAQGPTLKPDVVSHSSFGDSLFIRTSASDVSGINAIFLHVRKGGAVSFDSLAMAAVAADTYGVAVPRAFVQERGFDFFISSTDKFNNYSSSDTQFVTVSFAAGAQTSRVSRGSEQTAYRMVSAPNLLDVVSVDSIFTNSGFGTQDTTSWRLFEYRSNGYVERNSLNAATFQFTPGQAYWLISSKDRTIDFGSGVSLRADTSFSVTLKPGWNQIALPFAFPVAWADILAASGSPTTVDGPHFYSGSYSIPDILLPYAGYFVNNLDSLKSVELTIPALASESTSQNLTRSGAFDAGWTVQIIAKSQEAEDAFNYLGIQAEASDTWDPLDHSEPPPIGEYVSVSFPRPDWELYPNDYTTDFRAEIGVGQAWPFVVSTNIPNSETRITFAGMETIPPDLEVFLVDEKLNVTQDLRKQAEYTFASRAFGAKKQLKLLVGSSQFLADETTGIASVPDKFVLFQNFPNPFNPATTIRYGLPSAQEVTIRVYDILGREVTTLVDHEMKEAGFHALTWGGRNSNGRPVASGLYVYRIEAGKFSQTRKMLLVK